METGLGIVIGVGPSGLVNIVGRLSYQKDWKYTYGALPEGQNDPRAARVHARTLDDAFELLHRLPPLQRLHTLHGIRGATRFCEGNQRICTSVERSHREIPLVWMLRRDMLPVTFRVEHTNISRCDE